MLNVNVKNVKCKKVLKLGSGLQNIAFYCYVGKAYAVKQTKKDNQCKWNAVKHLIHDLKT